MQITFNKFRLVEATNFTLKPEWKTRVGLIFDVKGTLKEEMLIGEQVIVKIKAILFELDGQLFHVSQQNCEFVLDSPIGDTGKAF